MTHGSYPKRGVYWRMNVSVNRESPRLPQWASKATPDYCANFRMVGCDTPYSLANPLAVCP
ncbi:hypothetical protein R20233_03752 [Ralstonia sp. LMG 32965]|nr:hypothetical protein R20233_03752 [Ralstonia sp. LMG 32965]